MEPLVVWKQQSPDQAMSEQNDTIRFAMLTGDPTRCHGKFQFKEQMEDHASILSTE